MLTDTHLIQPTRKYKAVVRCKAVRPSLISSLNSLNHATLIGRIKIYRSSMTLLVN